MNLLLEVLDLAHLTRDHRQPKHRSFN
jgi:hypothetical protein